MKAMANQTPNSELSARVEILEKRVNELASLSANQVAGVLPLLVGWAEISAYCREKPRTLSRYTKGLAFRAYRLGRHVVSHPYMINDWLRAFNTAKLEARTSNNPAAGLTDDELKTRVKELDAKLKH
jgi:hypothetical protein